MFAPAKRPLDIFVRIFIFLKNKQLWFYYRNRRIFSYA